MAFKIIVDANFLLDLILKRSSDQSDLSKIYQKIIDNTFTGFTTTSVIQIVGYWTAKAINVNTAKFVLLNTLNDLKIIDAPHAVVEHALHSDINDIEDALQYYTAAHHKLDVFITKDKDFIKAAKPFLPIMHPKDFIKQYLT